MPQNPAAPFLAVTASLALALTACGTSAMQTQTPGTNEDGERANEIQRGAKAPTPRRNPHPTAYELTMTIEGAPGPFGVVGGVMQYETALNDPCLPRLGGMSGTRMRLKERVPVQWAPQGVGVYQGVAYTDLMLDEDYFGLGVCRWSMIEARMELRASGSEGDTTYFDGLTKADLEAGRSRTFYFWAGLYPSAAPGDINQGGQEDPSKFKPEVRDQLFKVTLASRKLPR